MLKPTDKTALLKFLKDWAKAMQEIFNERFGKNKVGHIIIAVDTGNNPTITYETNLRERDFQRCMRLLADKVNDKSIVTLN
jgi:hypothetical protein